MDAPNPSSIPTAANRTPLRIGAVGLAVRDLDGVTAYYQSLLKLAVLERTGSLVRLGTPGGVPLVELEHRAGLKPDDDRQAGLYHNAFLMPTRADLARWILHVAKNRVPVSGASDHGVSEAIYLDDPEANGIEVYSDRPSHEWTREGRTILQRTDPLDVDAIIGEVDPATATYEIAPDGLRVGHIHLRVGDTQRAEAFYCGVLGLEVTRRRAGATFMSTGGYHHHVGANVWHSPGAGRRDPDRAGLSWFVLEAQDQAALDAARAALTAAGAPVLNPTADGFDTEDPWGTRIRFRRA